MIYAYKITNGLIQPLGSSDELERLEKALDLAGIDHTDMQTQETELVEVNGKWYLSETDAEYQQEKADEVVEAEINQIDEQYREDKSQLLEYYVEFLANGDTEGQAAVKAELDALAAQYDADIEALNEEGGV